MNEAMRQVLPSRRVLVATDFSPASERALAWGREFARRRNAELVLVHAVTWPAAVDPVILADREMLEEFLVAARHRLDDIRSALTGQVSAIVCVAAPGFAVQVILDAAHAHRAELVVLGTRGLRGWKHALLGSTAQRVIARSPCPVLAVHASDPLPAAEPWRILATTDGSAASTAAVRTGLTLIGGPAEVTLLRAVEPDLGLYPPGTEAMATRWVAEARSNAERHLAEAAKELAGDAAGGSAVGTLLHDGAALPAILQAAERRDLVVMATRGSGLGHWFLGSTAERVAQRACVPVLVVPLDGCAIGGPVAEDAPSDEQC